jgi:anti-anti-sigma factor
MSNRSHVAVLLADGSTTAEILISGRVDRQADAMLAECLELLLTDPLVRRVEIDTSLVTFCDHGGLTVFLRAQHQTTRFGVPLHIVRAAPALLRLLKTTGLSQRLTSA